MTRERIRILSTCPASSAGNPPDYLAQVGEIARWSDDCGCAGILVYSDNSLVDPWLVASEVVRETTRLAPLVAVQPVYMHPYAVAKQVSSFGFLYGRRVELNMIAGGFKNDLLALGDPTPHDRRYERLVEYSLIVKRLCESAGPLTYEGQHYQLRNVWLRPPLDPGLAPAFLVSGSSEAGVNAARAIGATAVRYPGPAGEGEPGSLEASGVALGIRVGIIAREEEEDAWRCARERFPEDRKGQLTHQVAMKVSDSVWHHQLSEHAEAAGDSPYWLLPFQNYKTFCPYLVGADERVAGELARYFAAGYSTLILDVPVSRAELEHTFQVVDRACELAGIEA